MKNEELFTLMLLACLSFSGCTDWNSNPVDASRIHYSSFISNSTREAALSLRGVLTPALFQGVMSYMVWWLCTSWLITSVFGVVYLKMFETSWSKSSAAMQNCGDWYRVWCIVENGNEHENEAKADVLWKWQVFLIWCRARGVCVLQQITWQWNNLL